MPLFSVVTLIQQDPEILDLFLNSLCRTLTYQSQLIIVVDGTQPAVMSLLNKFRDEVPARSTVEVIINDEAAGYAVSANRALAKATGDIIVMADSDTILTSGWQAAFVATFKANQNAGAIGAKLLYPQTGGIQHCGLAFSEDAIRHLWLNAPASVVPAVTFPVQAIAFALCAIRREALQACGSLDEAYFNGYEDLDYCARIRAAGFQILVDPQISCFHWERSSGVYREFNRRRNLGRFWRLWGPSIKPDLWNFLSDTLRRELIDQIPERSAGLVFVDMCEDRTEIKPLTNVVAAVAGKLNHIHDCHGRVEANTELWLPRLLGRDGHLEPCRYIFAVHNFIRLSPNNYWWGQRQHIRDDDIVVDMYANVQKMRTLMLSSWPGHKIR